MVNLPKVKGSEALSILWEMGIEKRVRGDIGRREGEIERGEGEVV